MNFVFASAGLSSLPWMPVNYHRILARTLLRKNERRKAYHAQGCATDFQLNASSEYPSVAPTVCAAWGTPQLHLWALMINRIETLFDVTDFTYREKDDLCEAFSDH